MKKVAIYPGSFDPITNGHIEILERALKLFDEIYIMIGYNYRKHSTFTIEEKVLMVKEAVKQYSQVHVISYNGLVVNCATEIGAKFIIRGLRVINDFEVESQMSMMNMNLNKEIETVFLMSDENSIFVSSTIIKELAFHHQNVSHLVPEIVNEYLLEKFKLRKE